MEERPALKSRSSCASSARVQEITSPYQNFSVSPDQTQLLPLAARIIDAQKLNINFKK